MKPQKLSACTAHHIGDRTEQQDRVALITCERHPDTLFAVLADGMGGRAGGRMASDQVIATAEQLFRESSDNDAESLQALLEQIGSEAHTIIRLTAIASEQEPHSTVVMLAVQRDGAVWAHAGDSRLYLFRDGRLLRRTIDQTLAAKLEAEGRTREAASFKHLLTSTLGVESGLRLVVDEIHPVQTGDTFFLCSDGVWVYFDERELGSLLLSLAPADAAKRIVKLARERARGNGDNLALAIVRIDSADGAT